MPAKGKGRLERYHRTIVHHNNEQTAQTAIGSRDPISNQERDDEYSLDMRQIRVLREKIEKAERREERNAAVVKVIKLAINMMGGDKVARMARRVGEALRDKEPVTSEEAPLLWNYRKENGRGKLKKCNAGKKTEEERKKDSKKREDKKRKRDEEKSRRAEEAQVRKEMRQRTSLAQVYF